MSFPALFKDTLELANKPLDDNYEGDGKKSAVVMPPITDLPSYTYTKALPKGTTKVTLKSIREPKFQVTYDVPVKSSVFALKERLNSDPKKPLQSDLATGSIRLLLKSKVLPDTKQLAEIADFADQIQLTVMIYPAKKDEALDVAVPAQIYWGEEPKMKSDTKQNESKIVEKPELPGINDQFWREVEGVARRYVAEPKKLVDALKQYTPGEEMDLD